MDIVIFTNSSFEVLIDPLEDCWQAGKHYQIAFAREVAQGAQAMSAVCYHLDPIRSGMKRCFQGLVVEHEQNNQSFEQQKDVVVSLEAFGILHLDMSSGSRESPAPWVTTLYSRKEQVAMSVLS
eukprot:2370790-Amphidinium_carterae.1